MWWIALYLPQWPLEALGTPPPDAVEEGGAVVCRGRLAAQSGVHPGMSLAAAQARMPGLVWRSRRPELEAQGLRAIALAVMRLSPHLCLKPEGFLIELQASQRLFGGPLQIWQELAKTIDTYKVNAHMAAAPFAEAAWLLARVRGPWRQQAQRLGRPAGPALGVAQSRQPQAVRPLLDALPLPPVLQAWGVAQPAGQLLAGMGVSCLGELRGLPRAGLRRRLPKTLIERLDRAYGDEPDPRVFWTPPAVFDERLELPQRSTDMSCLTPALTHLLQALQGWLASHGRLAQVLALHLLHEARRHEALPDTVHVLRLSAPENEAGVLHRLWSERLGRHALSAPVVALRLVLRASQVRQTQEQQQPLALTSASLHSSADPAEVRQSLARLLDRLQARLGDQAVQGLVCVDDHRPERASRWVAPEAVAGPTRAISSPTADPAGPHASAPCTLEPLWLLPEPEPLDERQGRPVHAGGPLVLRTRPQRIEAGWFDGQPVCRDYHVAEGPDHRLRWVFLQRAGDGHAWFLHGWFG